MAALHCDRLLLTPKQRFLVALLLLCLVVLILVDQLLFVPRIQDAWPPYFSPTTAKCPASDITVSILLFGVPKSFQVVWDAYRTNIIESNPHVLHFRVYIHLYSDLKILTNLKNNEVGVAIESREKIRSVLGSSHQATLVTSRQGDFDATLEDFVTDEFVRRYFDGQDWTAETVKNMLRQGNSIKLVYSKASAEASISNPNHVYIFARSDTLLLRPIHILCTGVLENDLYIPGWQVNHEDEHVDRFAMAGRAASSIYAETKTTSTVRQIAASTDTALRNSEKIMKLWFDAQNHNSTNLINVHVMPSNWAPLIRVRANQLLNRRDYETHIGLTRRLLKRATFLLLLVLGGSICCGQSCRHKQSRLE